MIPWDRFEEELSSLASPGIRPGLSRLARLLDLLGNPQRRFPSILVVGTNGKGSTCSALSSCLSAGGYRVGLYTSPHLESPGERLRIGGEQISCHELWPRLERVAHVIQGDPRLSSDRPSYFEILTAVAFSYLADASIHLAVIEAGMGGRLDATNTLGMVECVVCAPIGLDHREYLGSTVRHVAAEKMAVIRPGKPAVFAGDPGGDGLEEMFLERCAKVGAKPVIHSRECRVELLQMSLGGCRFRRTRGSVEEELFIPLAGLHQPYNGSLALTALEEISDRFPLSRSAMVEGLSKVTWPGRMEWIPLDGSRGVILDGAHNPHGMRVLVDSLKRIQNPEGTAVVFAAMGDKDLEGTLGILGELKSPLFVTTVPGLARSATVEVLSSLASKLGIPLAGSNPDPMEAVKMALDVGPTVVVCGSLFLVGHVRGRIRGS
ncbi:FolC bifunctional protein [Thermanaerovibrio acidaminovorans DSM 6589]|uniref:tetrahydrofolate synthase n=1 Tax=Thermanaerovibrio acidaminovorans (strain ATCC 49978 / DSM 6589 / Su883) TaxID=525903 RepID=D1BA78_THEAS|nr:folylpolyglutamate synthase/dihydrofolate synthase family protein [Thermanaerovibrio acidaminovorans]ACZ19181.1 FolC bifunctional protein [Thermanaerovibrio acidaminovorans DSM 6589]